MTREITYNGKTMTVRQWAEHIGIKYGTLKQRLRRCQNMDEVLQPVVFKTYTYKGKTLNLAEWARESGISYSTLQERVQIRKWSIAEALEKPLKNGHDILGGHKKRKEAKDKRIKKLVNSGYVYNPDKINSRKETDA